MAAELDALRKSLLTPGSVSDWYATGPELGRGGFAIVSLGTERKSGGTVALKTMLPKWYPLQARVLFREIEIHARVNPIPSPNLLKLFSAHEDEWPASHMKRLTLVTQLCSGGDLFERVITLGRWSESDAATFVVKLAAALGALHAAGIIHRDLKPENILFSSKDAAAEPVIADFGLAMVHALHEVHDITSRPLGTPAYMSPEVITLRSYAPASDVWSLGVILYILLCGYPPFPIINCPEHVLFDRICKGSYEFHKGQWDTVSASAKELITRMLTLDPAARIDIPGILSHPWVTHFAPLAVAPLDAAVERLRVFNAKRKVKVAAMAAAFGPRQLSLARNLTELVGGKEFSFDDLGALSAAFSRVAGSTTTAMNLAQFREALKLVGATADLSAERLFALFDADGSGDLNPREVLAGLARLRDNAEEALRLCFDAFDRDRTGFLAPADLLRMLISNGVDLGTSSSGGGAAGAAIAAASGETDEERAARIAEVFGRMDSDRDGRVSFDEFKRALQSDAVVSEAILLPLRLMRTSTSSVGVGVALGVPVARP